MASYDDNPVIYNYKENDYIFWLDNDKVSINNYFIKPIRFVIPIDDIFDGDELYDGFNIEIILDSQFYKLIGPKTIQEKLENVSDINEKILINFYECKSELLLSDFYFDENNKSNNLIIENNNSKQYIMFPFYVIGKSKIEGTFLSNIMIKTKTNKVLTKQTNTIISKKDRLNQILKQSISSIKIYRANLDGSDRELWYTVPSGYNENNVEILYKKDGKVISSLRNINDENQPDQSFRISNFDNLPDDIYHVIFKLPEYKWLEPGYKYSFEGHIYDGCSHCGSVMRFNHDTYSLYPVNYDKNYLVYNIDEYLDPNYNIDYSPVYGGELKYYTTNGAYDENNNYIESIQIFYPSIDNKNFLGINGQELGHDVNGYEVNHLLSEFYGEGKDENDNDIRIPATIRDIWFDIDNIEIANTNETNYETIEYQAEEYTPITIGCTFINECEELIINGKNMGINLPKDIIKAFYNSSFDSIYSDEKLLRDKMKELLMNYMSIKGECGNFKSVLNSLKWFGWGNKIEISKLIKTDNDFISQYILDYFSITNDLKPSFRYFNTTNLISLTVNGNIETGETYEQNYDEVFIGEGKPILEDLFKKNIEVVKDNISFYKPYYRFIFHELALKLDCLKYYYQNYFLPVHIKINRASVSYKVYTNTVKMSAIGLINHTSCPIYVPNENIIVEFPKTNELIFCKTNHYVDDKFNQFSNYNLNYNDELYNINENNVTIPIKIINVDNQYSSYQYGEYIKIDDNYRKIYKFYKVLTSSDETDTIVETDDPSEASLFRLSKFDETLYTFEEYPDRYTKISEGYFNCRIILSCSELVQSDTGHYVYIDGEYKYKDKFYSSYIDDFSQESNELLITLEGNYINYYGKCIKIDPKDRYEFYTKVLVDDNYFNFYQSADEYYKEYVVLPRYFSQKYGLYNLDWLNTQFRLSMLVNDKWYYYDFKIVVPSLYLDFGKLQYKYWIDNDVTLFKQLMVQSGNTLKFNSFMYQPDLVTIDSLFYDKDNDKMLTFIEKLNETQGIEENIKEFYSNYFRNKIQIPYNKNYFNKIHLFKVYNNGNEIPYDNNPLNISLYNVFFDNTNFKISITENASYDAYLMHDDYKLIDEGKTPYWYIVFISRYPVGQYDDPEDLEIKTTEYTINNTYKIRYTGYSIEKFLINRMDIVPSNGYNHFNKNELVIVTVSNNDFQFNIDLSTKWEFQKIYDKYNLTRVDSNSNIAIVTNNNYNGYYDSGYYNVTLNYSVNGINDHSHTVKGYYMITQDIVNIIYPKNEAYISYNSNKTIDINKTISDFKIMYENDNGERIYTEDILDPSRGYHPIGIKVVNANYFEPGSPALYMGLTRLSLFNPDHGRTEIGAEGSDERPYFGMSGYYINGLPGYTNICFYDETGTLSSDYLCPQTDVALYDNGSPRYWCNPDGTPKWPAPNNRMWTRDPSARYNYCINILNDDDTFNTNMFDNNCALSNWNGLENNRIILDNFDENLYPNWRTEQYSRDHPMPNPGNKKFSPAVACAWRYHTASTNQGDWFIPSVPNVLFMMFNFKKYSDIFLELTSHDEYKPYCKPDLLSGSGNTFFTSTPSPTSNGTLWDIHMFGPCHVYSKTANWESIPYIFINE